MLLFSVKITVAPKKSVSHLRNIAQYDILNNSVFINVIGSHKHKGE